MTRKCVIISHSSIMRALAIMKKNDITTDVMLLRTTPMDHKGFFNFGVSNSFTRAQIHAAKKVIIEVNDNMPYCYGGNEEQIHISEIDAEWVAHSRQVGTTGLSVSPKLYVACGISGAVQHLAGMKKSEFIVSINTDRDAPIGEVADVFAVADLKQLLPVLTSKILAL